jgi:hypothetical protein
MRRLQQILRGWLRRRPAPARPMVTWVSPGVWERDLADDEREPWLSRRGRPDESRAPWIARRSLR